MKIVHIDLTGPFTEKMNYQENVIPGINVQDGHKVYFIATNYIWKDGRIETVPNGEFVAENGVHVIRLSYKNLFLPVLTEKLRVVVGLKKVLGRLKPDIIMLHGYQTLAVWPISHYMKIDTNTILFVDTHADQYNSAQNFFSKIFLHKIIYAQMARKILKYTESIWCISYDVMKFTEQVNRIPIKKLKYYPLGGMIFSQKEYIEKRKHIREKYYLTPDTILLLHSGKMNSKKKTTDILYAMNRVRDKRLKLLILGSMDEEVKSIYEKIAKDDKRIEFVGWKSDEEFLDYLCSADIYLQPGTQSATMQAAACCRCALALYPYGNHKRLLGESAFYIKNIFDIIDLLNTILNNYVLIQQKREKSYQIAQEQLDYRKLAAWLYEI